MLILLECTNMHSSFQVSSFFVYPFILAIYQGNLVVLLLFVIYFKTLSVMFYLFNSEAVMDCPLFLLNKCNNSVKC